MACSSCGNENAAERNFCVQCGQPLTHACAACGAAADPGAAFCGRCGAALVEFRPAAPFVRPYTPRHLAEGVLGRRAAAAGEHKYVTVLFCDIVQSSLLVHRLGAEAFHDLMEDFFALTLAEIHAVGGTINQFLGDGCMALFGAPVAHEDHARRAVVAAVAVRSRVARELRRFGVALRIGIGSGPVVVGRIGDELRTDYTAFGETVGLASRLQVAARPGDILLSDDAAELVRGYFRLAPVEPVRWNERTAAAFRVVGRGTRRYRLDESERALTPFVGRERDLVRLGEIVAALAPGRGRTVDVVGEPGLGKSRLLLELRGALADARVVEGRCVSYGSAVPYLPIVDLLRSTCDVSANDEPDAVAAKIEARVEALGLDPSQSMPFLLELVGQDNAALARGVLDPATVRARILAVLRDLWAAEGRAGRVVLAVEDLHWIDRTSEEVLASLVDVSVETGMLLVTTSRTGYRSPWSGRAQVSELRLQPLAPTASRRIVDAFLGDRTDAALVGAIVERGGGNPFFLEELANSARHDGATSRLTVPRTVEEVLAARIDQLGDDTKRAAQTAAVLGREFPLALIATVWDGPHSVAVELAELARLELLFQGSDGDEPVFRFKHALTQEVVYTSLLEKSRRALHGRAARAIERLHAPHLEPHHELLAHHYGRSDDLEAAAQYLILANRKAARRNAMEEAIAYFYDALRTLETLPDTDRNRRRRLRLVFDQTGEFHFLHRHREYHDLIRRHEPLVLELGDDALLGAYYARLGHRQWTFGEISEATATLERAAELCEACGQAEDAAATYAILAWAHLMLGNYERVKEYRDNALEKIARSFHPVWYAFARAAAILGQTWSGACDDAVAEGELAVEEGLRRGDKAIVSFSAAWIANAFLHKREWQRAREWAERSLAEAPTVYFQTFPQTFLSRAQCELGQAAQGVAVLAAIEPLVEASAHRPAWCLVATALGEARIVAGEHDAAAALFETVFRVAEPAPLTFFAAHASRLLGELALARGDFAAAATRLAYANRVAQETGARNEHGFVLQSLARLWMRQGDRSRALASFARAAATFDALGHRRERDDVRAEAAAVAEAVAQ